MPMSEIEEHYVCERQMIVQGMFDERECSRYGLSTKTCRYDGKDYYNEDNIIDYSCPCYYSNYVTRHLIVQVSYEMDQEEDYNLITIEKGNATITTTNKELTISTKQSFTLKGENNSILIRDTNGKDIYITIDDNNIIMTTNELGMEEDTKKGGET